MWSKALIPTKFGIAFGANFLNQGGALVHVYVDGTVLVTHGGVEMGQGLHTKMTQVAARALQIDVERVHVAETATDKVSVHEFSRAVWLHCLERLLTGGCIMFCASRFQTAAPLRLPRAAICMGWLC